MHINKTCHFHDLSHAHSASSAKTDLFPLLLVQNSFFPPFSPEVPVNDDPGDTQEQEYKPPPMRAPEAYNHHRAETEKYFIQRKLVFLF